MFVKGVVNPDRQEMLTGSYASYDEVKLTKSTIVTTNFLTVKINGGIGHNRAKDKAKCTAIGHKFAFVPGNALVFKESELGIPDRRNDYGIPFRKSVLPSRVASRPTTR